MPYYVVQGSRMHLQPRVPQVPRTPPTPMYSDDDQSSDEGAYPYDDYRDRDRRHIQYNYGQSWQRSRTQDRDADRESDRESTEPTVSGFEPTYEQVDRHSKAIVANDQDQLLAFKTIQAIHPAALEPYGFLPKTKNPRTGHYDWLRRTPKGVIAMVWCRINNTASDVVFEVTLHTDEVLEVHVPLDSWHRKTCDPEAVRASIQQAYLNLLRGHDNAVIVKPGMKSLRFITQHEYEDICHSSSSSSSSRFSRLLPRHQRSQSQKVSYQVPVGHDRRPAIHLSSPPPPRPHHQQPTPQPQPRAQPQHQPQSQPQPPYHHRSRSQSQVLPAHPVIPSHQVPVHHAQPVQVFSSPVPSPSPYTTQHHTAHPSHPPAHHQANYKSTGMGPARASIAPPAQPGVFPSRTSRTSGYY